MAWTKAPLPTDFLGSPLAPNLTCVLDYEKEWEDNVIVITVAIDDTIFL